MLGPLLAVALQQFHICGMFGDSKRQSVLEMQIIVVLWTDIICIFFSIILFLCYFFIFMAFVYLYASKINKKIY